MDSLGYKLLVDKATKRKIAILSELEIGPVSLKTLQELCNVSERTVLLSIEELNGELPSDTKIEELTKNFFSIRAKNFFSITNHIKMLMRESPLFLIIEAIFEGKQQTIEDISEELFISESTVRKYLLVLEDVLAEFYLSLSLKPIEIEGDEANIRYFFFLYFRYGHDTSTLLEKSKKNAEAVYGYLDKLVFNHGVVLHVDYHRILTWLFILEKRLTLKKNITLDKEVVAKHIKTENFSRSKKVFYDFFSDNQILANISQDEEVYMYVLRLSTVIYDSNGIFFLADYEKYTNKFKPYVKKYFSAQNLYPTRYMDLQMKIQCFLANLSFLTEITPLFQKASTELHTQIKENFPSLYEPWVTIMKQENKWEYPEEIAVNLTVLSSIHLQLNLFKYKKVLFSLTGEPTSLTYYKTLAYKFVPKEAEVYFFSNRPITPTLLKTLEIDIVISNFLLFEEIKDLEEVENIEVIRLSDVPSKVEWENLLLKLYDI